MAQTLPNGVVVPNADGGEQISATGVAEMRTLGASVDSALAAKASTEYVDAEINGIMPRMFFRGLLPFGTNVDDMHTTEWAGMWIISNATQAASITGLPSEVPSSRRLGQIVVMPIGSGVASMTYTPYGFQGVVEMYFRNTAWGGSTDRPHEWNPWVNLAKPGNVTDAGGTIAGVGMTNEVLREVMARRRGGTIGVGDKGAIALRFDHGLNNFKSIVVPLLRKYNLPCSQAYLSAGFTSEAFIPEESDQASWGDVAEWARTAGVEPMAHSRTHLPADTEAQLRSEIVDCYTEMAAALPESAIEAWAVPGGGGTRYMGFDGGGLPKNFYNTVAGAMILSTYAYSMGYIQGAEWLLDGAAGQGGRHSTVDTSQAANAAKTNVTRAAEHRTGYVLMLHPRELTNGGDFTTAEELESLLAHVAALRDAGRIEVMTIGGLVHAKTGSNTRLNLINAGHFPEGWDAVWGAVSGYTRHVENGIAYVRTSTAARLAQTISNRRLTPHRGAIFEIIATVRTTSTGTVRIQAPDLAGASQDFNLVAAEGWREVRQFVTFPLNSTADQVIHVGRVAGSVDVMNVRVQPI